jgi:hypothetical protein
MCVEYEIRSKYAVSFRNSSTHTGSAECARGMTILDETATWKGDFRTGARDKIGLWLDLQIIKNPNREGVARSKGGKAKRCARREFRIPFSLLRPEALPGHIQPSRGESRSQARRVPVVSRYIPSVETPFPANGSISHTQQYSAVALIIAFPFW